MGKRPRQVQSKTASSNPVDPNSLDEDALLKESEIALASGDCATAITYAQLAVKNNSQSFRAHYQLALSYYEEQDNGAAEREFEWCERFQADPVTSMLFHAEIQMYLGQLGNGASALAHFEAAFKKLRSDLAGSGDLAAALPGDAAARASFVKATRGRLARGLAAAAELYMTDLCDLPEAETRCCALVDEAVSVDPSCVEAHLGKCSLRISQCRPEEAKEVLANTLRLLPGAGHPATTGDGEVSSAVVFQAAKLAVELGFLDGAKHLLHFLLLQDQLNADVWFLLAFAHNQCEEWEPVLECVERLEKLVSAADTEFALRLAAIKQSVEKSLEAKG